jgi:hypothetical protein
MTSMGQPPGQPPSHDGEPLTGRLARFAAALSAWPRRTLRLEEIWQLYADADPASAGRPERRAELAAALSTLEGAGMLAPSKTTDRTAQPLLPTRVTLSAAPPQPGGVVLARATAWRPELAWASSARLTTAQVHALAAVNVWLRDRGRDTDRAPLRERSLEVLGHEKALDRLLGTGLFGPGRLTLELLRTFRAHPPLPAIHMGAGSVLLVAENADTFATLLECVRRDHRGVGWIAWGGGGAFEASVRSAGDLDPAATQIRYFGDLDYDGLRIAANACATARTEGLPPLLPAVTLYRQLLATQVRQGGQPQVDEAARRPLTGWLASAGTAESSQVASEVTQLLHDGQRVPQEALGSRDLITNNGWAGCG